MKKIFHEFFWLVSIVSRVFQIFWPIIIYFCTLKTIGCIYDVVTRPRDYSTTARKVSHLEIKQYNKTRGNETLFWLQYCASYLTALVFSKNQTVNYKFYYLCGTDPQNCQFFSSIPRQCKNLWKFLPKNTEQFW